LLQGRLSGDQTARLAALVASLLSGGVVVLFLRVGLTLDDLCVTRQDFPFQTLGKGWKSLFNFDLYERISLS
jgi:hypothetical protein